MTGSEQQSGLRQRVRNVVSMFTETYVEEDKAMVKYQNKLQLTKIERLALEFIMFSPIFIVFASLYTFHSYLGTLVAFHVALTFLPFLFLKYKKVKIDWVAMIKQDLAKYTRNLNNDLILALAPSVFFTGLYIIFRNTFPDYDYTSLRMPSINDTFTAIALLIEFVIVNPIVEELFWRVFCDAFTGFGRTIAQKIDVSLHFGAYHTFVFYFITQDPLLSLGGCIAVCTLGYILTIAKQRYGIITATVIHIGVDLAAAIAIVDMQARFIPFY